jgi:hypothetical protein
MPKGRPFLSIIHGLAMNTSLMGKAFAQPAAYVGISIFESFEPILKYGMVGLSAILAGLAGALLYNESNQQKPRARMLGAIRLFMMLAIGLALISVFAIVVERLIPEPKALKARDAHIAALEKELGQRNKEIDTLRAQIGQVQEKAAQEREAFRQLAAASLEDDLAQTREKGESPLASQDVQLRRARQALFFNISIFPKNPEPLRAALEILVRRTLINREITETLLSEANEIRAARLTWVRDVAIPALHLATTELGPGQSGLSANVELPPEFCIESEKCSVSVSPDSNLDAEKQRLDEVIASDPS